MLKILLVEDDDVDVELVQRALSKQGFDIPVVRASNGAEALDLLQNCNDGDILRQPFIILLDINMPRMDGHEFLSILRQDARLKRSVVFVLTTSDSYRDRKAAYDQHVAGYILKSKPNEGLTIVMSFLHSFARINEFPPN